MVGGGGGKGNFMLGGIGEVGVGGVFGKSFSYFGGNTILFSRFDLCPLVTFRVHYYSLTSFREAQSLYINVTTLNGYFDKQ